MIKEDLRIFKQGGSSSISNGILTVNASRLITDYENNQFKYEKTYKNKIIRIKTVSSGVQTDFLGEPYVIADGRHEFEYVSMALKNKNEAMNINKGSRIDMICLGTDENIMFPSLLKCVGTGSYLNSLLELSLNNISKLNQGDQPSNTIEAIYLSLWEYDNNNPNVLAKYKSAKDINKDKRFFGEISKSAAAKLDSNEKSLFYTFPML